MKKINDGQPNKTGIPKRCPTKTSEYFPLISYIIKTICKKTTKSMIYNGSNNQKRICG